MENLAVEEGELSGKEIEPKQSGKPDSPTALSGKQDL